MGPQQLVDNLGEFLGYVMIRKVAAGQDLLRAAYMRTRSCAKERLDGLKRSALADPGTGSRQTKPAVGY